jgi:hypothetical protein
VRLDCTLSWRGRGETRVSSEKKYLTSSFVVLHVDPEKIRLPTAGEVGGGLLKMGGELFEISWGAPFAVLAWRCMGRGEVGCASLHC